MADFLDAIVEFPTIIFTVIAGTSLTLWIVTTAFGVGFDALDGLTDIDVDVDADAEGGGVLAGALGFLGLASLPITVSLTLSSIFAWLISLTLMTAVGSRTTWVLISIGVVVFFVAAIAALAITAALAKPLARVFVTEPPPRRGDFVGKACIVRTERVTADFGQAEVVDAEGATLLLQVRCDEANELGHGDEAVIWSLDDEVGVFQITPTPLSPDHHDLPH